MDLVNQPGTPKLWAIAYENKHKHKNSEFFVMPLKHVQSVRDLVNQPGTPKLWAIAHENGHKRKNDEFFYASQTYTEFHGPYKSPWNPKTVGNSSRKRP
jgi:hypothetical protein